MHEPRAPERQARQGGRRLGLLFAGAFLVLLFLIPLVSTYEKPRMPEPAELVKQALEVTPGGPPSVMQMREPTKPARAENVQYVLSLPQEVLVDVRSPDVWLLQLVNELQKQNIDPRAKALLDELGKQEDIDPRVKAHMDELVKQQSSDPRARITLETVIYDPETEKKDYEQHKVLLEQQREIERKRVMALSNVNPEDKQRRIDELNRCKASLTEKADELLKGRRYFAWTRAVQKWLGGSCLVVNGRVFKDLNPQMAYDWWEGTDHYYALRFKIVITEANKQQWLDLLGGTGLGRKPVAVSIAMVDLFEPGKTEIVATAINPSILKTPEWQKVILKASTDWLTWALLVCFFALLLLFLHYAFATKILRDLAPDGLWRLSLGRCQMAFWFFIITGSYIFLWIVTGDYRTLTSQELLLMGLSSVTGLGAYLIAARSDAAAKPLGSEALTSEEIDLESTDELEARADLESQKAAQLTGEEAEKSRERVAELRRRAAYYKKGWGAAFWRSANDLVSEANDGRPSFHRFQMIGWTLAFGVIFLRAVYYKLAMPEFSADQLLLMGISNGTYLGFKWSATRSGKDGK